VTILVTGAAGFIGYHVAEALLARGLPVIGVDNLSDYYDVGLKQARLARLRRHCDFGFFERSIADRSAMFALAERLSEVTHVIHLAGQAGVRHSIDHPYAYVESNVMGQVVMLELARALPRFRHFVYASSSSVYGESDALPFSAETDRADNPVSLYAATKRSGELIATAYHHIHAMPVTGLRFFTVYGPWGRPDMAYFKFVKAAFDGKPIQLFDAAGMKRDFTYIDDIVAGILGAMDRQADRSAVYNLGNNQPVRLMDFVAEIERATGRTLTKIDEPRQKGDVPATFADIDSSRRDLGFEPKTSIREGLPKFVEWYRQYYKV
jgi:UDP-glucuronate 4-epimerase